MFNDSVTVVGRDGSVEVVVFVVTQVLVLIERGSRERGEGDGEGEREGGGRGERERTRTLYCIKHLGCMYKGGAVNSLTVVVTFHLEKVCQRCTLVGGGGGGGWGATK